ncbi:MAG: extracellular solute-binding protein [Pseudomonadales bacterium]
MNRSLRWSKPIVVAALLAGLVACDKPAAPAVTPAPSASAPAAEVVVYSTRNEQLIKPVFDAYTQQTGVKVSFVTDKEGPLLERLKQEGQNTQADVLLTVDAGSLWLAAQQGLLQPVESAALQKNVAEHLRDPGKRWFGLSARARSIFYNPTLVKPEELSTYQALANDKWAGKLCLRTSKKVYNQSLVAMLIAANGEAATEAMVRGWVDNLAVAPFSDDTKLLEAIAAGECAVGIVNTYYFGRLLKVKPDIAVKVFWPNQGEGQDGVHVNVSGAGVTTHAKHRDEAVKLLEWMSSTQAQNLFADSNMEYPVNWDVKPAPIVSSWGDFKPSAINISKAGELQAQAVQLMDRAGYQ